MRQTTGNDSVGQAVKKTTAPKRTGNSVVKQVSDGGSLVLKTDSAAETKRQTESKRTG